MKLYRYFYDLADPFRSFTELDLDAPEDYVNYIQANGLHCARSYDRQYFEKRLATEAQLRQEFIRQGGKPVLQHPYYLVVEACDDWFYHRKGCIGALCIDLDAFDPDTVSFTYGDSVPALDPAFRKDRSYHGRVYTLSQLPGLIEEFGLPQKWNPDELLGYETYIEAQIWAPMPIALYRPGYGPEGSALWQSHCTALCRAVADASPKLRSAKDGVSLFDCLRSLQTPRLQTLWHTATARLTCELFGCDPIHNTCHSRCCGLYMLLMGLALQLPDRWLETAVLAGLYHDIGRSLGTQRTHGECSARMLPGMFPELGALHMAALQTAVHMHCITHADFDAIWQTYSSAQPDKMCRLLTQMLKNADSLDYIRLGIRGYNLRFLTLDAAKALAICAMEANLLQVCYPNMFTKIMNF